MEIRYLNNIGDYLEGTKFSSGLNITDKSFNEEKTRIERLVEILNGKRVIHLGFTDHLPLIDKKIANGQWLHGKLDEVSEECYGIDINEEAVNYVREHYGYSNVRCANILDEDILENHSQKWDYILLGELLEHIDNPVHFLSKIHDNYIDRIDRIMISVPNVLNVSTLNYMEKGIEHINTDHRYWFTPYTILKVLSVAGYKNAKIYFVNRSRLPFFLLLKRKLKRLCGLKSLYRWYYFDTLLVEAEF